MQKELHVILNKTRETISDYAGQDRDKWFYANRFVFAGLQLDERKTKTNIKKELFEADKPCYYCKEPLISKTGIHMHRIDGLRGYSLDNCVLMHPECHTRFHAENPRISKQEKPSSDETMPILEKVSQRYEDKSFLYWWDISPGFTDKMDKYEAIEFVKKDNDERCYIPIPVLKGYLTKERQTTRGNGNWGIKVLKDKEDQLAFEPGSKNGNWLFLPVVWLNDSQED